MHVPASFDTLRKVALIIGIIATAVSCKMTGSFGWEISWVHGVGFICITIMAGIIFPFRHFLRDMGMHNAARAFVALGALFIAGEFFGDIGYTIGQREKSLKSASFQTVKADDVGASIAKQEEQEKFFTERLAELRKANPWAAAVNAEALRGKLESATLAIEQEAARGGCKSKCLERTKERDGLKAQIAVAEEMNTTVNMIEATKRKLEALRTQRAGTPAGHTPVKSQSDFVAKLYMAFTGANPKDTLNPDEVTLSFTEIFIGFFIAAMATLLPTVCFYMAFVGTPVKSAATSIAEAIKTQHAAMSIGRGPARMIMTHRAA